MKKSILLLLISFLPVSAIADCEFAVKDAVLDATKGGAAERILLKDISVELKQRTVGYLEYTAVANVPDLGPIYYDVWAKGVPANCGVTQVTRTISSNTPIFDEKEITVVIDQRKYTLKKGLVDAAILASFPVMYKYAPRDKFYHYVAGASAALAANRFCYEVVFKNNEHRKKYSDICGVGAAALAGALKEFYDSRTPGHTVDFKDFAATAAGGAVISMRFILF